MQYHDVIVVKIAIEQSCAELQHVLIVQNKLARLFLFFASVDSQHSWVFQIMPALYPALLVRIGFLLSHYPNWLTFVLPQKLNYDANVYQSLIKLIITS